MDEQVLAKLRENVSGDVSVEHDDLEAMSIDASIFQVTPQAVATPNNVDDLKTLVHNVNRLKDEGVDISLTPRAAGTCMSGGPLTQSVVVDMKPGFSWIDEVNEKEGSVWVGAGTYHRDVAANVAEHKLLFAPYTSSRDLCVIGGMIGNNASGEKSIRYGATVDNIMAIRMVCSNGEEYEFGSLNEDQLNEKLNYEGFEGDLYRQLNELIEHNYDLIQEARPNVRKNSAGYGIWRVKNKNTGEFNIAKLMVGAQGTLGFVTAAKLRLVELRDYKRMLVVPVEDLSKLAKAVQIAVSQHPDGVETYDHHTYELAKKYLPEEAEAAKIAEGQHMVLIVQFSEHTKDQTDHHLQLCKKAYEKAGYKPHIATNAKEIEAHWAIRRASYGLLLEHPLPHTLAVPFLEDTIVSIDHYGEFLAAVETILQDYDMTYTYAGHIGDGSIRLIPLVDMEQKDAPDKIFELMRRIADLVFAFGGSMSVDHNDGLIRSAFLPRMYGEDVFQVFKQVKVIFDPRNIFNPGKKIGGNIAYSKAHMKNKNDPPKSLAGRDAKHFS